MPQHTVVYNAPERMAGDSRAALCYGGPFRLAAIHYHEYSAFQEKINGDFNEYGTLL
jgi:hypothetical protein